MNKNIIFTGMVLAASLVQATACAEEETSEQIEMRMFGGYVRKDKSAKGKVVILNAQHRVPSKGFVVAIKRIASDIRPEIELKETHEVSLPNPQKALKAVCGNIGVVIVDDGRFPSLLTAPEEGWAVVNVAALAEDKPSDEQLASRVRKEILRGFALASGCSFMARGAYALRPNIRKPRDLDFIQEECYGIDAMTTLASSLKYYGVTPWLVSTYENACAFGWAPAPTNEYQRAIWEKVHTPPTKPIKVTYDKDKQKPVVK